MLVVVMMLGGAVVSSFAVEAPVAKEGYTLATVVIGECGIPALVLSKDGSDVAKRPAVILVHGGAIVDALTTPGLPYKEEWFRPVYEDVPYRLAGKGMLVVAIDASWAESRLVPAAAEQFQRSPLAAVMSYYMDAVKDISDTITCVSARPDVDPDRIGIAGKSGGAITCLMAACQEPRVAAVVSWKGGADFKELARLKGQEAGLVAALEQVPGFRERLERNDPINAFEAIPPKAIALINNREDPAIPRATAEVLVEKLRPLYKDHPDRLLLKLIDTPAPTHDDQVEAFDAGCAWLETHLLAKDPSGTR